MVAVCGGERAASAGEERTKESEQQQQLRLNVEGTPEKMPPRQRAGKEEGEEEQEDVKGGTEEPSRKEEEKRDDSEQASRELREMRETLYQLQRENAELRALRAEERKAATQVQYGELEKKQLMKTIRLLSKEKRTSQHVMNLTKFKAEMRALELEAELHQEKTLRRRAESGLATPEADGHALQADDSAATDSSPISSSLPEHSEPYDLIRRLREELAQERREKQELRQLYDKRIAQLEALVESLQNECKPSTYKQDQEHGGSDDDDEMHALHSSLEMSRVVSQEQVLALVYPPEGALALALSFG
jgi:hypothetical protein